MRYFPSFDEFAQLAAGHTVVPVYRQLFDLAHRMPSAGAAWVISDSCADRRANFFGVARRHG